MESDLSGMCQDFDSDYHPTNPFHSIFQHSAAGMTIGLMDGTFLHVNPAFCRMVGYSEEELHQMKVQDITHPEDREKALQYKEEIQEGDRQSYTYEKRYIQKDGTLLWCIVTVAWVYNNDRKPVFGIGMVQDISEFKQIQEKMLEGERIYRLLIEKIQLGISFVARDRTILMANPTLAAWFGKPARELIGKKCFLEYEKRSSVCPHCPGDQVMATGQPQMYVSEGILDDGSAFTARVRVFPLGDGNGESSGYIEVAENITELENAEKALKSSEERFRALTESAPIGIFECDAEGGSIYHNSRWNEISGLSEEESSGEGWAKAIHPDDRAPALSSWRNAVAEGRSWEHLYRILRPDGRIRWVRALAAPAGMEGGKPERFVGTVTDVTEREETRRALEESDKRFRAVFEQSNMGMCVFSPEGEFLQANEALCSMLGYTEPELLTMTIDHVVFQGEDGPKRSLKYHADCGRQVSFEERYRCKDGSVIWTFVSGAWVFDSAGEVLYGIGILKDITAQKETQEKLDHMAFHDQLTGLPNRSLMMDRLEHALARARRSKTMVAVIFFDLDRFKDINDTYDHLVGDEVLAQIASRLNANIRESDTLARFGGDEFVIVTEDVRDTDTVAVFAEKILDLLKRPISVGDLSFHISASMGISVFPRNGRTAERLLRSADAAMYRAKEKGRNMFQFYNSRAGARSRRRVQLESELRMALEEGQFDLYYQPQFDLSTGVLVGFEALIRWLHPDRGMILPGSFISLAEETGLIIPLGRWVLMKACSQAMAWNFPQKNIRMSLNISAGQFLRDRLDERISEILEATGLPAENLELELTESMIMENVEQSVLAMEKIDDLGISMTIDDFGTGYSSLAYLKSFPIRRLKIDRSFVKDVTRDKNSAAIANAIIGLAGNMNLEVVAEGIETPEQMEFLLEHGCWFGQGYLLAEPQPSSMVSRYIEGSSENADGEFPWSGNYGA